MDYEKLEQHIYENDIETYDIVTALHPFYRYRLYEAIRKNRRLSTDCDIRELAFGIIQMLPVLPEYVVENFELASFSYHELLSHQRITGTRLARKANRARINIRKKLQISPKDDDVQNQFDVDKKHNAKRIILKKHKGKKKNYTAADSIKDRKKKSRSRDWGISQCTDKSARIIGLSQGPENSGWFISLTLPGSFHRGSYEDSREEISRRLEGIKRDAARQNILWFGILKIHDHKDETPHIHIIYYVSENQRHLLNEIFFKWFDNEKSRAEENFSVNQRIYAFDGCLGYIFHDYEEQNTHISFIGLKNNIKTVWSSLYTGDYNNPSLSYLSDRSLFVSKNLMNIREDIEYHDVNGNYVVSPAYTLFALSGFKSEEINQLGYRKTDISNSRFSGYSLYIKKMQKYLNRKCRELWEKHKHHRIYKSYVFIFVKQLIYINTKIVYRLFFDYQCNQLRGQPPPFAG